MRTLEISLNYNFRVIWAMVLKDIRSSLTERASNRWTGAHSIVDLELHLLKAETNQG